MFPRVAFDFAFARAHGLLTRQHTVGTGGVTQLAVGGVALAFVNRALPLFEILDERRRVAFRLRHARLSVFQNRRRHGETTRDAQPV